MCKVTIFGNQYNYVNKLRKLLYSQKLKFLLLNILNFVLFRTSKTRFMLDRFQRKRMISQILSDKSNSTLHNLRIP